MLVNAAVGNEVTVAESLGGQMDANKHGSLPNRARIFVQVTIYRRILIGRDGHLDQSEPYDISELVR